MRYFFHLRDGTGSRDPEGMEMPSIAHARRAAVQLLGETLRDRPDAFWDDEDWQLEVTNADGLLLFSITVFASMAAAAGRAHR